MFQESTQKKFSDQETEKVVKKVVKVVLEVVEVEKKVVKVVKKPCHRNIAQRHHSTARNQVQSTQNSSLKVTY